MQALIPLPTASTERKMLAAAIYRKAGAAQTPKMGKGFISFFPARIAGFHWLAFRTTSLAPNRMSTNSFFAQMRDTANGKYANRK